MILAKSHKGTSSDLKDWLTLDSLHKMASKYLTDSVDETLSLKLDRIDVRQEKGMVKCYF